LGGLVFCQMSPTPPDKTDDEPKEGDSGDAMEPALRPRQRPTRTIPVSKGRRTVQVGGSETPSRPEGATREGVDVDDGSTPVIAERKLIARTEDLADRALDRLKSEVALPNVLEEAQGVARTVGAIRSPALAAVVGFYLVTASVGVAATAVEGIHDWFMHVAMYVVVLSFLILYVKSHLMRKHLARAVYAVATAGLMAFFGWVLNDLVASRLVVVDAEAIERPTAQLLQVPSVMLLVGAFGLLLHWLVLARYDSRR
jgi:hypothetical protein